MASTVAINPAWTLQSANNAADGRAHDFAFLQQANAQPMQLARAGVIPSVATSGNATAIDLFTTQSSSPAMSVQINPGSAVAAASGRGPYIASSSSLATLTVATANGTNPRLDLVYLQVLDQAAGDASTATQLGIVTGTPAASPTLPSLPATGVCIPISSVLVPANATSIVNADITDLRKSAGIGRGPRFLLGGDALSDPGFCYGEQRQRRLSTYPANGTDSIVTDYWGFDSVWHGTKPLPVASGNIVQNTTNWVVNAETKTWTLTIPDPGWAYYINLSVSAFRSNTAGTPKYAQLFCHLGSTIAGTQMREFTADSSLAGFTCAINGDIWNGVLGTAFTGGTTICVSNDTGQTGELPIVNAWCSATVCPV